MANKTGVPSAEVSKRGERLREWAATNPLRSWRGEHNLSILAAAADLGASMTSVRLWEYGVHTPGEKHMAAIAALLDEDADSLTARWALWASGQPK